MCMSTYTLSHTNCGPRYEATFAFTLIFLPAGDSEYGPGTIACVCQWKEWGQPRCGTTPCLPTALEPSPSV